MVRNSNEHDRPDKGGPGKRIDRVEGLMATGGLHAARLTRAGGPRMRLTPDEARAIWQRIEALGPEVGSEHSSPPPNGQ